MTAQEFLKAPLLWDAESGIAISLETIIDEWECEANMGLGKEVIVAITELWDRKER